MIYTLTLNPSIDYLMRLPSFLPSDINRAEDVSLLPGGKGINVSIVLTNLGIRNKALGFVSGDTGKMFVSLLSNQGIDSEFIEVKDGFTRINVKVISGSETQLNGNGPQIAESDLDALLSGLSNLSDGDTLVLSGSLPSNLPSDTYARIISRLPRGKIRTIVDTTGDSLTTCLIHKPYMIKPNHTELAEIYGKSHLLRDEIIECAKDLQSKGAQNVLVSMGGDGAILVCEDGKAYFADAPKGEVISTVGAGDSTVAGFIYAIENGFCFQDVLNFSVSAGSATAFTSHLASAREIRDVYGANFN